MTEIDIEGAGLWQFPFGIGVSDHGVLRPLLEVPSFKLPRGIGPLYRELFHESPLYQMPLIGNRPSMYLPIVGNYQYPFMGNSSTNAAATKDDCNYAPMLCGFTSITYDRIAVNLTTNGGANSVYRMGFYANDGAAGIPSTLILDAGTVVADAGATVVRTITISQKITRGWFYTAGCHQVGTAAQYSVVSPLIDFDGSHDSTASWLRSNLKSTGITGAFASAPATTGQGAVAQPLVGVRIASYEA